MSFDDLLADANDAFEVFEESVKVIYRPLNGLPRPIAAVIDRHPPAVLGEDNRPLTDDVEISVRNDSIQGISSAELQLHRDQVCTAGRFGGVPKNLLIVKVISSDGGRLTLRIR
jgi:hypothetical protein